VNRNVNVNVEQIVLLLHDHLIASAGNQSVETELWGGTPGERSQDGRVRREEASLHGLAGWRLGWTEDERPSLARSPSSRPKWEDFWLLQQVRLPTVSPKGPVLHAVTPGTQCVHTTGEVLRGLFPPGRVTASYKQAVKGWPDASATGTASYRPCPWGCQQSQSSPATRDERQNRSRSVKLGVVFGKVSPTAAATKWPAGTSSWQPAGLLRNILRHGVRATRTKCPS
jgi:hypothetical protein